jgi:hypothetical protein
LKWLLTTHFLVSAAAKSARAAKPTDASNTSAKPTDASNTSAQSAEATAESTDTAAKSADTAAEPADSATEPTDSATEPTDTAAKPADSTTEATGTASEPSCKCAAGILLWNEYHAVGSSHGRYRAAETAGTTLNAERAAGLSDIAAPA